MWKYYDDGYNPANTVQQTRKLVEEDKVFALFGGLGTEPQQAVVDYLNQRKVPQLFVSTGATEFGELPVESVDDRLAARLRRRGHDLRQVRRGELAERRRSASSTRTTTTARTTSRVSGRASASKASNIITTQGFEVTDTSVAPQVAAIRASSADVIAIFATPTPTIQTYATMKALKYRPEEVILNSVSATDTFMKLALANSDAATVNGSISTAYLMNPQDPKYANNAYVKLYKAQMAKYAPQRGPEQRALLLRLREGLRRREGAPGCGQEPDARKAS